jgi:hypothetical protein
VIGPKGIFAFEELSSESVGGGGPNDVLEDCIEEALDAEASSERGFLE